MSFNLISKNFYKFLLVSLFILFGVLGLARSSWAADFYITQNVSGANTGADCANAHAVSWFNASGNWSNPKQADKIGQGDTVHLCGTITSQLTVQNSGSSGSPITILFEPGAKIQPNTYCGDGTNACLDISNKSYIVVDGGTTCGRVNGVDVACNGKILSTDLSHGGEAIYSYYCSNCEVHNLEIGPICVPASGCAVGSGGVGIGASGTPAGTTLKLHNNHIHHVEWGITYVPVGTNDNGLQIYNNWEHDNGHHIDIGNNGNGRMAAALIYNNHLGSTNIWDDTGCPDHHNALHVFGMGTGINSGIDFYNNLIDGNWGNCSTGGLYFEGNEQGHNRNIRVFNNLWNMTYTQMNNGNVTLCGDGPMAFYNNTIFGRNIESEICFSTCGAFDGGSLTYENNILVGCSTGFVYRDIIMTLMDRNLYANGGGWTNQGTDGPQWWDTLLQWKLACLDTWPSAVCDANSFFGTLNGYAGLNSTGQPQSGSPAINTGANLTSLGISALNFDLAGVSRPQGSAWDIGAYEYIQASPPPDTTPPAPPSGVTIS